MALTTPATGERVAERKEDMEELFTICVYGDFKRRDIRIKIFKSDDSRQYSFQNTLIEAKYDAVLISANDEDVQFLAIKEE